jgi:hypothetical protein
MEMPLRIGGPEAGSPRIVSSTDEMEPELINSVRSIEQDDEDGSPSVYELEPKAILS